MIKDAPTTESRVRTVLDAEGFDNETEPCSAKLIDLGLDSLDLVELALAVEEEFSGIEVHQDDERDWVTILDVVQYVDQRTAK